MLVNFSNHPFSGWSDKQVAEAQKSWGEVVDLAFPMVDPNMDKAEVEQMAVQYQVFIENILQKSAEQKAAVHIMGELSLCFALVGRLKSVGIKCVVATTLRETKEEEGKKISIFNFVRFRSY